MNPFPESNNVARMHASSTLKAAQTAAALRSEGVDVIDLTVGEPDFDTPEFIKDYAREGLAKGLTKYTPSSGMKSFQESIAEFYAGRFGANFSSTEVAAACGGKQALFNAACTILNPGDEVLKDKSVGLFIEVIDPTGKDVSFQKMQSLINFVHILL